jgi:methionyl-tRNA formyltransferase
MTQSPAPRLRVLFFGTPEIAVPTLRALTQVCEVVAVVCQPDKAVGLTKQPQPPPVKVAATELGIVVHQPSKVRTPEFVAWVGEQRADVAVVFAYGRILIKAVLDAPRLGCVNFHASLLPKYRGAAPIQWAIVRGEHETGISVMLMDEGMDTGPVYLQRTVAIGPNETAEQLGQRLAELGASMAKQELLEVLAGKHQVVPQDNEQATLAPILQKTHGLIDWEQSALQVHNQVRGLFPWPGGYTHLQGKMLKIIEAKVVDSEAGLWMQEAPGSVVRADKSGIWVRCGQGLVSIDRAQMEGRKALDSAALVAGRTLQVGIKLGTNKED